MTIIVRTVDSDSETIASELPVHAALGLYTVISPGSRYSWVFESASDCAVLGPARSRQRRVMRVCGGIIGGFGRLPTAADARRASKVSGLLSHASGPLDAGRLPMPVLF